MITEALLFAIDDVFAKLTQKGDPCFWPQKGTSIFASELVPLISVESFLKRICKSFEMTEGVLISSLIYIDRYLRATKVYISLNEIHRLIGIACVVSIKHHEDHTHTNRFYAKNIGLPLKELNMMEGYFLDQIGFCTYTSDKEYENYSTAINCYSHCLLYTSPSPRDQRGSRMPSSA
eukprot:TRINITY_DN2901_c0_g1_i9.p1 TRINITY_DN2901_c0_g1~~TRINITY_DN2901_c0_g1_i9.p1  ORF type:complete len:177 (-),score=31.94 TRINITY_DN2901_c0_g1_i9:19-549(-)